MGWLGAVYYRGASVYSAAMSNKFSRQVFAAFLGVLLLSSQYAVASYVCLKSSSVDMSAFADVDMSEECAVEMKLKPSSLCKAHCDQTSQSSEIQVVNFPVFLAYTVRIIDFIHPDDRSSSGVFNNSPLWLRDGSPPLRIQYQVFRI